MPIGVVTFSVSTNSSGGGTATTSTSVNGEFYALRMPAAGTAITSTGGTTDFTLLRSRDGGTIASVSNVSAPWDLVAFPGEQVPVFGTVSLVVAQGQPSASGTVYAYYRR